MNFRIGEGNAVSVTADEVKAILINYYHFSKDPLYSRHASYIVPKGSPLQVGYENSFFSAGYHKSYIHKDKLKQSIMWLRDTGVLEKVKHEVMNPPNQNLVPRVRYNQPLILRQLGIIMVILIVGLFIALIVFLVELLTITKLADGSRAGQGIEITPIQ